MLTIIRILGRDKIAKILVKHGADIDIRDSHAEHMTALEWAEKRGNFS